MRPIERYVEGLMRKTGIKSYAQLSQRLEMNAGAIFNIMSKGVTPSDELCGKLAALAGDPVEKVLLLAAGSRAPESTKPAWERLLKAAAKAGVFTLMLLIMFSATLPSISYAAHSGYYVKLSVMTVF